MAFTNIIDIIYPIGSFYITTNSTSPATLFGGTWASFEEGRCIRSAGTSYAQGEKAGEEEHFLDNFQMPGCVWQSDDIDGLATLHGIFDPGSMYGIRCSPSLKTAYHSVSLIQPVQNEYIWYRTA